MMLSEDKYYRTYKLVSDLFFHHTFRNSEYISNFGRVRLQELHLEEYIQYLTNTYKGKKCITPIHTNVIISKFSFDMFGIMVMYLTVAGSTFITRMDKSEIIE